MKIASQLVEVLAVFVVIFYLYCRSPAFRPLMPDWPRPRGKFRLYLVFSGALHLGLLDYALVTCAERGGAGGRRAFLHDLRELLAVSGTGGMLLALAGPLLVGTTPRLWTPAELRAAVRKRLKEGIPPTAVAAELAAESGWNRRDIYKLASARG